jgi:hypothetical protein
MMCCLHVFILCHSHRCCRLTIGGVCLCLCVCLRVSVSVPFSSIGMAWWQYRLDAWILREHVGFKYKWDYYIDKSYADRVEFKLAFLYGS